MDTLDTFTAKQILEDIASWLDSSQNVLVVIGALYTSKVVLSFTHKLFKSIWTYVVPRLWRYNDFPKCFGGKWAVVTGASEGIGRSYALRLAERKMNILLVSRSEKKLRAVAKEIETKHGNDVQTICYPLDMGLLTDTEVYDKFKAQLDELDVGVLVNNVGKMFDRLQYFLTVPVQVQKDVVNLNVMSVVLMTQLILPQMVKRGNGAIVNIGSGASVHPTPFMSTYSAAKAFVDTLTKSVHYEYANKGVTMQCVQPFYVSTNMTHNASPNLLITDPDTYVESAITTLGFSARNYGYWTHAFFGYLGEWLPENVYMFFASSVNTHLWSWLTGVTVETKKDI